MTREEILVMKPGRELDEAVFVYVMGGKIAKPPYITHIPRYSTDISAAWEVVEKMSEEWPQFSIARVDTGWCVMWGFDGYGWPEATGKTAPEAICKAALLAVMEGEEK